MVSSHYRVHQNEVLNTNCAIYLHSDHLYLTNYTFHNLYVALYSWVYIAAKNDKKVKNNGK